MAATYVHLTGRDVDNAVLKANGLKPQEESVVPKLAPKICQRCKLANPVDAAYCKRCAAPLDIKIAVEVQEQVKTIEQAVGAALKDPAIVEEIVHAYLMNQREKGKT